MLSSSKSSSETTSLTKEENLTTETTTIYQLSTTTTEAVEKEGETGKKKCKTKTLHSVFLRAIAISMMRSKLCILQ